MKKLITIIKLTLVQSLLITSNQLIAAENGVEKSVSLEKAKESINKCLNHFTFDYDTQKPIHYVEDIWMMYYSGRAMNYIKDVFHENMIEDSKVISNKITFDSMM